MTYPFARRTFWRSLLPEHRPFVVLTAVLGALIVVIASLVAGGTRESYASLTNQSALTLVEVSSAAPGGTKSLTDKSVAAFAAMKDVAAVHPWAQAGILSSGDMTPDGTFPVVFWATAQVPYVQPPRLPKGSRADLKKGQIVLPSSAGDLSLLPFLNRTMAFTFQVKSGPGTVSSTPTRLRVVGFYDPASGGRDGPGAAYVSVDDAFTWSAAMAGQSVPQFRQTRIDKVYVQAKDVASVEPLVRAIVADGYAASSMYSVLSQLPQALNLLRVVGYLLAGLLAVLCLIMGASIGSSYASTRRRTLGLLRAVGWSRRRVLLASVIELALLGLLPGVLIVALALCLALAITTGFAGHELLGLAVDQVSVAPPLAWAISALLGPAVALVLGALPRLMRATSLAPDEALRDL